MMVVKGFNCRYIPFTLSLASGDPCGLQTGGRGSRRFRGTKGEERRDRAEKERVQRGVR